ncbi:hypothetical protein QBC36DRAFT_356078 [Triangularia setosa]|uniref:Uncharacterized protein n=1 Tax=Triangularia setosa TaxID=2587417 RepID=A0AAN7A5L3_9PEZI|nr:hypothetical protein QBC36DRAFT_356078 [Podospora setosa]
MTPLTLCKTRTFAALLVALGLAAITTLAAPPPSMPTIVVKDAIGDELPECWCSCACSNDPLSLQCCGSAGGNFDDQNGWCVDMNTTIATPFKECCGSRPGYSCYTYAHC